MPQFNSGKLLSIKIRNYLNKYTSQYLLLACLVAKNLIKLNIRGAINL